MIFITGDTHGRIDIKKLTSKGFPEGKMLSKNDYVIVAGDFGFLWNNDEEDKYWLKWFEKKKFSTLFIDGNHENFNIINSFPVERWNGGKVHRINDSVSHLIRGQIFHIDGVKLFTFGGASSDDIEDRKENASWWKEEMPSKEEYEEGLRNLEEHEWEVDYILTHACSVSTQNTINALFYKDKKITELNEYFELVEKKVKYKHWYFGHYHRDKQIDERHTVLYQNIIRIL